MRAERRGTDELLAAYVDGVAELSADERRRVEARLADDGALRAEADEARALLGKLRALPRGGPDGAAGEPDWAALERSILDAVGPEAPRPWWRRLGLRLVVPAAALAAGAAIFALVVRNGDPGPARVIEPAPGALAARPDPAAGDAATPAPAPGTSDVAGDAAGTIALWLDGEDVEVDLDAEDLLEVPWEGEHHLEDLLPASDLAWVDELAEEELDRAEALLDDPALKLPAGRGGRG